MTHRTTIGCQAAAGVAWLGAALEYKPVRGCWRGLAGMGGAFVALLIAAGGAYASPGCDQLNGELIVQGGNVVSDTGSTFGTGGFNSGDVITASTTGLAMISLQDFTQNFATIVQPAAAFTYTVPAKTADILGVHRFIGGFLSQTITWSCTSAGSSGLQPATPSQKLRALQIDGAKSAADWARDAISDVINGGIGTQFFSQDPNPGAIVESRPGLFLNFTAEPRRDAATQNAVDAFAYAGGVTKAPRTPIVQSDWIAWADLRGGGFDQAGAGAAREENVSVMSGVGRKLSPDLGVGVFAGYETFGFTMDSIAGKLTGDGVTIGAHAEWRFADRWRAEGIVGWSDVQYRDSADTASGSFNGSRWLTSAGFTGTYRFGGVVLEPATHVDTLWESEKAWTDSLGTLQAARTFSEGRVATGAKASYPWMASPDWRVAPYVGLYGDWRFSTDDALPVALPVTGIKDGWSGRVTTGLAVSSRSGTTIGFGGELGGLGAGYMLWSLNGRLDRPF